MALYRSIYTTFWSDSKINDDFSPEDKYFYLYLLTNPKTTICGCYEVSFKNMSSDLGYDADTVKKLIKRMAEVHKVISYCEATKEILILNWSKYNWTKSPNFIKGIKESFPYIKCPQFKKYIFEALKREEMIDETDPVWTVGDGIGTSVSVSVTVDSSVSESTDNSGSINRTTSVEVIEPTNVQSTLNVQGEDKLAVPASSTTKLRNHIPPTIEEVANYCTERNNGVDPEEFWDFYQSKGWTVGKEKMKDWQASVRTWERNRKKKSTSETNSSQKTYCENEIPLKAAKWLSNKIHSLYPSIPEVNDETLQQWASEFDNFIKDGHEPSELSEVMHFVIQDDFWKSKISSPSDLIKHYVKIMMKAESEGWFN